jgi:hypothetical protein
MERSPSGEHKTIPEYWLYWTYLRPELLRYPLRSVEGTAISIIEAGEKNEDNGPDFRNAVVEINGLRCRGDVEFHCFPEDWFRHGHHQDTRYGNVILHVVWDVKNLLPEELSARFPHLSLRLHLRLPESRWREKMMALEENRSIPPGNLSLPAPSLRTIADLAEERFQRKIDRLRNWSRLFSLETVLYIALAEAWGYSKNKFPFRQLMWENPPPHIYSAVSPLQRSPLAIWVFLALQGGLLESHAFSKSKDNNSPAVLQAKRLFQQYQERGFYPLLKLHHWNFSRLRPHNHPCLRLAGLSQLLYIHQSPSFFEKLLRIAARRLPLPETLQQWHLCFQFPFDRVTGEVLQTLLGFRTLPRFVAGVTRQRQFFLNGLLPLLHIWAEFSGNEGFRAYVDGLYESFPSAEEENIINTQLSFIADAPLAGRIRLSGFLQQGMIEYLANQHLNGQMWDARMS